jgi:rfaE bifunctional protein nucleotidyltransferase chain/domain
MKNQDKTISDYLLAKHMQIADAQRAIAIHHLFERKVVFTNGCFDILHRGHLEYLAAARSLGAMLIVGLNSDASVARLKGPARPVNGWADRCYALSSLFCVDAVIDFDEDTPLELIKALKPDILVKGGDYEEKDIIGAEAVTSAGGTVQIIPLVNGYSTTSFIEHLNEKK